jgi:hypothetical protein
MEMPNNFAKEKPRLWFIIDTLLNLSLAKTVPANSTEDYSLLTGMASVQGEKKREHEHEHFATPDSFRSCLCTCIQPVWQAHHGMAS